MKDNAAPAPAKIGAVDIEAFAKNLARMVEQGGKALAAYMKPREEGQVAGRPLRRDERHGQDARRGRGATGCPIRTARSNCNRGSAAPISICGARRPSACPAKRAGPVVAPDPKDRRFADPEWSSNQFFDFVKQAYLLSTNWADHLVEDAKGLDPHTRQKAEFYVKQVANALSPSNFVLTNPELLRETLGSNAENLARGMHMLAEDIEAGGGDLKIRQSDAAKFEVGRNLAVTPGKVDLRKRADAAHPVRAVDAERAEDAAADLPALDQQVLRARSHAGKILHQMVRRSGAHGVRDLLGQSGRAAQGQGLRGLHAARARSPPSTPSSRRPARRRSTPSAIASAARCCRSRSPTWRPRTTTASHRRRCSRRRSISPTPATSRCSSTRSSSRRWKSGWPSAAISKAARWPTPSTCCAPTT